MSFIKSISIILISGTLLAGCKEELNLPEQPLSAYIKVYMPQAANGPVTYEFSTIDTVTYSIIYGANYGGAGYPDKDISVKFAIDAAAVDSFNTANKTNYLLLPAKSYTMEESAAIIKKGELSTPPFKITVATTGENAPDDLSKTYLLPVMIQDASATVNPVLKTHFCIVSIIPALFDRNGWNIIDYSSQESSGEGPNNGRAIFILDNNINTFWHSQWQGNQPPHPHHITIDMGTEKRVSGASFVARQGVNAGRPNEIQIFLSDDNTTWTLAYEGTLLNDGASQKRFFQKAMSGRYVKLQINSSYSSNLSHLAEFNLF
jgi:hypothetical protein